MAVFVFFARHMIAGLFTNDEEILAILYSCLVIISLKSVPDFMQTLFQGKVRAIGLQGKATIGSLVSWYVVAIPISYTLGIS